MKYELVSNIIRQTEVILVNAERMLKTCNLDFVLCDMPVWKHVYHMLLVRPVVYQSI